MIKYLNTFDINLCDSKIDLMYRYEIKLTKLDNEINVGSLCSIFN